MSRNDYNPHPPAILLGGGIIALAVARSLGKAGIGVFVLDERSGPAHLSRYTTKLLPLHDGDPEEGWREFLLRHPSPRFLGGVILPLSDEALVFVSHCRQDLEKHYRVIEADDRVNLSLLDKATAYQLARRAGIATPYVLEVDSPVDLLAGMRDLTYPCALKPRVSHRFTRANNGLKMQIVHNADELVYYFKHYRKRGLQMLATELIPLTEEGHLSYYTYLDKNGRPMFHFTKRRIRQYPTVFGAGTHNVTTWDREVAALGLRFLQSIGLRGIGTVEFMRDPRDGALKFIEANPRLTGTTELVVRSGLNLPLFVYRRITGGQLPSMGRYDLDVHTLRPLGEWMAFREMRRKRKISWREWMATLLHRQHFLVFRLSDPLPSIVGIAPFVRRQLDRLRRAGAGRLSRFPDYHVSSKHEFKTR